MAKGSARPDVGLDPETGPEASRNHSFLKSNRGVASILLVMIALIAAHIWFSEWAHRELRDGFLLGGFPLFAVLMMAASLLVLFFDGQSRKVEPGLAAATLAAALVVLTGAAVLGLTFIAFDYIGFVPAITAFILGSSTFLGYRPVWSAALIAICVAGALRLILHALGVDIDDGLAWAFISKMAG